MRPKGLAHSRFDLARKGPDHILTVRDETFAPHSSGNVYRASCCVRHVFWLNLSQAVYSKAPVFLAVEARTRDSLSEAAPWTDLCGRRA